MRNVMACKHIHCMLLWKSSLFVVTHYSSLFLSKATLHYFAFWFLDVAFEVGGKSGVNYLVLQVHYGKVDNFVGELAGLHVLPSIEVSKRTS